MPTAAAVNPPAFFTPGIYGLVTYGLSGAHTFQDHPGSWAYDSSPIAAPSLSVTGDSESQRQEITSSVGDLRQDLAVSGEEVLLEYLSLEGIPFRPAHAVHRPQSTGEVVTSRQEWGWSARSTAGGVDLDVTYLAGIPTTEVHNGLPVVLQPVRSDWFFGGNADGQLKVTEWHEIGGDRFRAYFEGSVYNALSGTTTIYNTVISSPDLVSGNL
jgi:hypothetical protein